MRYFLWRSLDLSRTHLFAVFPGEASDSANGKSSRAKDFATRSDPQPSSGKSRFTRDTETTGQADCVRAAPRQGIPRKSGRCPHDVCCPAGAYMKAPELTSRAASCSASLQRLHFSLQLATRQNASRRLAAEPTADSPHDHSAAQHTRR